MYETKMWFRKHNDFQNSFQRDLLGANISYKEENVIENWAVLSISL